MKNNKTNKISFWSQIKFFFSRKPRATKSRFQRLSSDEFGSLEPQSLSHKILNFEEVAQLEKKAALRRENITQ